jgi:hypothetical protein
MNRPRVVLITLFSLIVIMACALPGGSADPTSEPVPTVDTELLQVMVNRTVTAALALTEQAAATPEMQMDEATEPSPTPAAADETPTTGSSLAPQTDGTTLFTDEGAKFQLNVSPGWLPVRIDQPEYYDAFSLPAAADAAVQRALMNIKTLDPNTFRLFIYDLQDGHMINGVITSVNFVWDPQVTIPLETESAIRQASEDLAASIPNLNIDSYSVSATASNIPIGVILSNIPGKTFEGTDVVLFQKQVYLNLPVGSLVISFTTEQNFKDATLPFFDTMVETIKINP